MPATVRVRILSGNSGIAAKTGKEKDGFSNFLYIYIYIYVKDSVAKIEL